jgi:hypothetical protein
MYSLTESTESYDFVKRMKGNNRFENSKSQNFYWNRKGLKWQKKNLMKFYTCIISIFSHFRKSIQKLVIDFN